MTFENTAPGPWGFMGHGGPRARHYRAWMEAQSTDQGGDEPRGGDPRGGGPRGPRGGGPRGRGFMGPDGPFGAGGPFGPEGAFGPGGTFGPRGPFGQHGPFGGPGPFGGGGRGGGRRRGDVRDAILALLAESPLNGYQIIQTLAERTGGIWKPSPGAVYPALSQLEDERLIEAFDNEGQRAFRLTESGQAAAARIETKPWETIVAANVPNNLADASAMWKELGGLAAATKAVMANGSPAQIAKATETLAAARRAVYGVLASEDVENGDDLR